jgi:hypothetical protein
MMQNMIISCISACRTVVGNAALVMLQHLQCWSTAAGPAQKSLLQRLPQAAGCICMVRLWGRFKLAVD